MTHLSLVRLRRRTLVLAAVFGGFALNPAAHAQFKVTGPAPYSAPVARQKIRALLEKTDANNRHQTITTLDGLLAWYRDIIDEEMIAAWQKDTRGNLPDVVKALADAKVAAGVLLFSWGPKRPDAFLPAYAPMFEDLLIRFPDSGRPMMDDLVHASAAGQPLDLSEPEAETVCRILIDMPEVGLWRKQALQILPFYRATARTLLAQDLRSGDPEKVDRANFWLNDPRSSLYQSSSGSTVATSSGRRRMVPSGDRPALIGVDPDPSPGEPPAARPRPDPPPAAAAIAPAPKSYNGPLSGTLQCRGDAVPQNAEYVFRNLPPLKIQLDYDTKIWDARLVPGDGDTQRLILKNKSSGAQKRCMVHWTASQ
jgi:hypothetical protein